MAKCQLVALPENGKSISPLTYLDMLAGVYKLTCSFQVFDIHPPTEIHPLSHHPALPPRFFSRANGPSSVRRPRSVPKVS